MKRSYTIVLLALVCLAMGVIPSFADSGTRVNFQVGFAFSAGESHLPAGAYSISTDQGGRAFITGTRSPRGGVLLVRSTDSGSAGVPAAVHFLLRGGQYYLDTVTLPDGRTVQFNSPLTARHRMPR